MKLIPSKHFKFAISLAFMMAVILSYAYQNYSNHEIPTSQVKANTPVDSSEIDSTLLLKFKTGIRAVLEDSKGNIWFGSHQEGLCLFDGEQMTYFTEADGLSNNQIRSIFEDSTGVVWFEGGKGISSYDGEKIITHHEKNYDSKDDWKSSKNDIWFKGDEATGYNILEGYFGVYRYDGKTLNYHVFPNEIEELGSWAYSVSTPFAKGKNGRVWFGTYQAVFGFDGSSFTIIDNYRLGYNEASGYLHVRSIFEDSKGNLWIGNNGIGVLLHDGTSTINFSESQGLISLFSLRTGGYKSPSYSLEHVFAIGEDLDGNMWFGDRDTGAWRYDGKSMKNYREEDGLSTTHIWQIYNSKNGELWFAMDDGNVLKFNGNSFERIF